MDIKVSIVIPIYNMEAYLAACVESVLKQTYKNIELILVDDGSTDESYKTSIAFAAQYKNIIAVHQENRGSGSARNTGIAIASGKYVFFADADDYLNHEAIEKLVALAKNDGSDLLIFGYHKIKPNGQVKDKVYKKRKCTGEYVRTHYVEFFDETYTWGIQGAPWNKFFSLEVIKKNNVKYPGLKRHQDEVFISRYVAYTENVLFVPDVLYSHRLNTKKLVYEKFPVTYMDIVKKLYKYRKEIIGAWAPKNKILWQLFYSEYINNVVKACCLVYNPKLEYKRKDRISWYKEKLVGVVMLNAEFPKTLIGRKKYYQNKIFLFALKHKWYWLLDVLVNVRANI